MRENADSDSSVQAKSIKRETIKGKSYADQFTTANYFSAKITFYIQTNNINNFEAYLEG